MTRSSKVSNQQWLKLICDSLSQVWPKERSITFVGTQFYPAVQHVKTWGDVYDTKSWFPHYKDFPGSVVGHCYEKPYFNWDSLFFLFMITIFPIQPWWLGGRAAASFNTSLTSASVDQIPLEEDYTHYKNVLCFSSV